MLDRLQGDFQRPTDFASDLAHELRTPISNLLTQTQVALTTKRDAATYRDIPGLNAEEFQRLARMVSDMLFLAKRPSAAWICRTRSGFRPPGRAGAAGVLRGRGRGKRIRLQLKGTARVEGDRLMFRRAVSNLLSNALRYTPGPATSPSVSPARHKPRQWPWRTLEPTSMPRSCPGCSTASTEPMLPGPIRTPMIRAGSGHHARHR